MKPIGFKEQTEVLQPPPGVSVDWCGVLPVLCDGTQTISLWKFTWKERWQLLFRGRLWVGVVMGHTQPPIWFDTEKEIFKSEAKGGAA